MDNIKIAEELVKLAKDIEAGTWGLPKDDASVNKAIKYIKKMQSGKEPVPNKDLTDVFYNLVGDDDLFDKLDDAKKYYFKDCAETIVGKMKELVNDGVDSFQNTDDYNRLVEVLKKTVRG